MRRWRVLSLEELRVTVDAYVRPPTPPVVWLLAGAIVVSYAAFALAPAEMQNALDLTFALIPERFHADNPARFEHWYEAAAPLFGHAFLHLAWWHAGLNAFFFFLAARLPALRLGAWRFLAVFFAGAVAGGAAFIALNWNESGIAVGASGAVCGVFSAYFLSARPTWREALADPAVRNPLGMIFLLNVVIMGVAGEAGLFPIAWEGHLGGFIGGAAAYIALAPRPRGPWG
jgi:membrane associated rhomboid family serine protease